MAKLDARIDVARTQWADKGFAVAKDAGISDCFLFWCAFGGINFLSLGKLCAIQASNFAKRKELAALNRDLNNQKQALAAARRRRTGRCCPS